MSSKVTITIEGDADEGVTINADFDPPLPSREEDAPASHYLGMRMLEVLGRHGRIKSTNTHRLEAPDDGLGPFKTGEHRHGAFGAVSAEDRIRMARGFNRAQCERALAMPQLQATVRRAVERRLRQLDKEAHNHD